MSFLSNWFKSTESSSDIAKNRLKLAITSDRAVCSPELMELMKNEIIAVIAKYVDIDTEGIDVRIQKEDTSGTISNAILANIPIKEGSKNFRK